MSLNPTGRHTVPPAFIPQSHQAAAIGLVDFNTVNSNAFKERSLRADWDGVHRDLLAVSRCMLKEYQRRGWPMFAHTYWRTREDQEKAFKAGNSKARYGSSPHNYGMAVDIVHFGRWWELTRKEWDVIGMVGKEVIRRGYNHKGRHQTPRFEWGGDWKFYDPAHWELKDWRMLKAQEDLVEG